MNKKSHTYSKFYLILISVVFLLSSCITNRDLEYLRTGESNTIKKTDYSYLLKPGDLLSVQISTVTEQLHDFFNKESTSNSQLMLQNPYLYGYLINDKGFLDLPSFGKIKAEGFTLRELEKIIKEIAVSYFEKPVVKLNIINFDISILGEVNNPGRYKVVDPNANILQALSLAGDITQFGDRKRLKVIRKNNDIFYIDLTNKDVLLEKKYMLQPHDIIYVSQLKKRFYSINNLSSAISLILSSITIFLLIK